MHILQTLSGSWEPYNNRKVQTGQDPNWFSPEELWEFDYLVKMIQETKPHLDELTVILAMREGMRKTVAPRPRNHFIELVMENISVREAQWALLLESMGNGVNISPSSMQYPYIAN